MTRNRRPSGLLVLVPLALAGLVTASPSIPASVPACLVPRQDSFSHADYRAHFERTRAERKAFMKTLPSKPVRKQFQNGFNAWEKRRDYAEKYANGIREGLAKLEKEDHQAALTWFGRARSSHEKARGFAELGADEAGYYHAEAALRFFHKKCTENEDYETFFHMPGFGHYLLQAIESLSDALSEEPKLWTEKFSSPRNGFLLAELAPLVDEWQASAPTKPLGEWVSFEELQGLFEQLGMIDVAIGCCSRRLATPDAKLDAFLLQVEKRGSREIRVSDDDSWWLGFCEPMQSIVEDGAATPEVRGRAALCLGEMMLARHLSLPHRIAVRQNQEREGLYADRAEAAFREAMKHLGSSPDAQIGLAVALLFRGGERQLSLAAQSLERALEADPTDLPIWLHLAMALTALGEADRAHASIGQAVSATGTNAKDAWLRYSALLDRHGHEDSALAAFRKAAQVGEDAQLWRLLGMQYRERGSYEEAEGALREAITRGWSGGEAWALLAENHVDRKQAPEAEAAFLEALGRAPDDPAIWRSLRLHFQAERCESNNVEPVISRMEKHVATLGRPQSALCELASSNGLEGQIDPCARLYVEVYGMPGGDQLAGKSLDELVHLMKEGHRALTDRILEDLPTRVELMTLRSTKSDTAFRQRVERAREKLAGSAYGSRVISGFGMNQVLYESHQSAQDALRACRAQTAPSLGVLGIVYANPCGY